MRSQAPILLNQGFLFFLDRYNGELRISCPAFKSVVGTIPKRVYDSESATPRATSSEPATMDGTQQHEFAFEVDVDRPTRGPARAGERDFGG